MTSTAREIAVGVDGSDAAARALTWACDEALRRGLGLHLLHAWHEPMVAIGPTTALLVSELQTLARRQAEELLASLTPDGLPARSTALEGPTAAALAEAAEGADQLVVGDRGRGATRRALLGSVSTSLVQHPRNVVTVVGKVAPRPSGLVVVGVDDSPAGRRALSRAAMEADAHDAHLLAVHARQRHEGREVDVDAALRGVVRSTLPRRRDVDLRLVSGDPVTALLEASRDADLLVVGTRGLDRFERARIGSVAAGCVHHARCPVQVVPSVLQVA